ncbi:hypothetical protein RHMOL_Rhmol05G0248400 [Rhododendron molle]|uniref:Uncharacterized protein n=1 Tax=Rhododendron molle TaxID=49168 RepID=A0ACC0NSY2_RHOML|nr:hypothetical protein RHMOL_Rhmol05G0248400 [Rhododendron molle]
MVNAKSKQSLPIAILVKNSYGMAEVVFSQRKDAEAAVKRYNNVQLDGKPMMIEILGTNIATPATLPPPTIGMFGDQNGAPRRFALQPYPLFSDPQIQVFDILTRIYKDLKPLPDVGIEMFLT